MQDAPPRDESQSLDKSGTYNAFFTFHYLDANGGMEIARPL